MAMVMVAAIFIDGADDEDDDDNDDVEHDVKADPIVDSRSRLEQHNIKSSNYVLLTSRTADAGRTTIVDAIVDMSRGGEVQTSALKVPRNNS